MTQFSLPTWHFLASTFQHLDSISLDGKVLEYTIERADKDFNDDANQSTDHLETVLCKGR